MDARRMAEAWNAARAEMTGAGWSVNRIALDAAAVPLALSGDPVVAAREALATAERLKGLRGHRVLRSQTRFILAPLLEADLDVVALGRALDEGRRAWRAASLRRDEPHRTLTMMALLAVDAPLDAATMRRLHRDWRRVKGERFWHAGPDLLPPLALAGTINPDAGGAVLERAGSVRGLGLRGDTKASLRTGCYLAMSGEPGTERVMIRLQKALQAAGCKRAARQIGLLGAAALSSLDPDTLAEDTAHLADALKRGKRRPSHREATALSLLVQSRGADETAALSGALSAVAAVAAQQAAVSGAVVAGAAASTAGG